MKIYSLLDQVEKDSITEVAHFLDFAQEYLDFINYGEEIHPDIQAEIVSKNEPQYHFFQYKDDGHNCVTRPVNTKLLIPRSAFASARKLFLKDITDVRSVADHPERRANLNRVIYTCQQCIGCTLDALDNSNRAKKKNGNYFEILMRDVIRQCGIHITDADEKITLTDGESMKFEHDVILLNDLEEIKAIGQLKTSSKDRIDKIFLDKYMYNKLKKQHTPHFAIFLNDVQRKENRHAQYGVNSTFLPGHFKAYTIALNPLDGVYYADMRPAIEKDAFLSDRIKSLDHFLVEDMWAFVQ